MMASLTRTKQLKRALTFLNKDERKLTKPIQKGYLFKESHRHGMFNKRFFALYPRYLVYYEHEHDYDRDVKHGNLENRHGAVRLDRLYLSKPDVKPKGGKYCFVLHSPDGSNKRHEYLLVAKTREDRRQWMTKLQDQNPKLLPHDHHVAPDTPVPPRKIRSDSRNVSETDISKLSVQTQSSNPDSDVDEHELDLHEGDSDHEYHEPNEENEVDGHNCNGDSECITVSIPVEPLPVKFMR